MLNGLDLFSGIGGITLALSEWVRPTAYCEIDPYAQGVLLSRMSEGQLPKAPIWDDIASLRGRDLPEIDIIYGGFPCQDISVAGRGKGLVGERSGLFFEIMRLISEIRPAFLFLENVPAITTRGLGEVTAEITKAGYDCRWITLSAAEIGANHKRDRWWLLAYSNGRYRGALSECYLRSEKSTNARSGSSTLRRDLPDSYRDRVRNESGGFCGTNGESSTEPIDDSEKAGHSELKGLEGFGANSGESEVSKFGNASWWATEPNVGRVANGIPFRVDKLRGLGNAVVPLQAKEAFKELMGIK